MECRQTGYAGGGVDGRHKSDGGLILSQIKRLSQTVPKGGWQDFEGGGVQLISKDRSMTILYNLCY